MNRLERARAETCDQEISFYLTIFSLLAIALVFGYGIFGLYILGH